MGGGTRQGGGYGPLGVSSEIRSDLYGERRTRPLRLGCCRRGGVSISWMRDERERTRRMQRLKQSLHDLSRHWLGVAWL